MTQRENFHRLMNGQAYDHVPFDLPMTPPVYDELERRTGTRDAVAAFDLDFRYVWGGGVRNADAWKSAYFERGVPLPDGAWVGDGGYVERPGDLASVGAAYHLTEMFHPLSYAESLAEIQGYPWHDLSNPALYQHFPEQIGRVQLEGRVATLGLECTVFESAWYLRGMEELFCDLIEGNGIGEWLFDRYEERSSRTAAAAAQAGVDIIRLGDDIGTQRGMMMSVPFWREHLKPRLARVIAATKVDGKGPVIQYHSDGDVSEVVDDLIEIGVDILNPVQPECMPIDAVADRWMHRLGFSGMIGTQTTMPFGTTDDVRQAVQNCEKWIHQGAKMLIAPTHVLEPDVPWENILALSDEVRRIRP